MASSTWDLVFPERRTNPASKNIYLEAEEELCLNQKSDLGKTAYYTPQRKSYKRPESVKHVHIKSLGQGQALPAEPQNKNH
jgi:hypothetical protein